MTVLAKWPRNNVFLVGSGLYRPVRTEFFAFDHVVLGGQLLMLPLEGEHGIDQLLMLIPDKLDISRQFQILGLEHVDLAFQTLDPFTLLT